MRKIPVYHIDAFTNVSFGGNPAGVIPDASKLTEYEMQCIASELNLPESAFLLPSTDSDADFKVRYFTPQEEINFCGHATLGLSWYLATTQGWSDKADQLVFETNVGLVPVSWVKEKNQVTAVSMTVVPPRVKEFDFDQQHIAELVGVNPNDIDDRYPIKLANTGNWHLLVPVTTRAAIDAAEPKLKELGAMNREYDISTTHLFTFDTVEQFDMYTRDFAPGVGINEDPVTGSANGALAGYLFLEGFISKGDVHRLTIGQGHAMGRPGELLVTVDATDADHPIIQVAGSAVITIEGVLSLK